MLVKRWIAVLALPLAASAAPLQWPRQSAADALLPADQAFMLLGARREGTSVTVRWQIAPGYYLYRDRFAVRALTPPTAQLKAAPPPPAQQVREPEIGTVAVYRGGLTLRWRQAAGTPPVSRIEVRYQGCADVGVCYPPQTRAIAVAP